MINEITFKGSYTVKYYGSVLPFSFSSPFVQVFQSSENIARQIGDIAGYVCPVANVGGKFTRIGIFQPLYYGTELYYFPEIDKLGIEYNIEIFAREYEFDFKVSVYEIRVGTEIVEQPSSLEEYVTKRVPSIPMSAWTPIALDAVPFDNFVITGVLVNEAPNINTNIDVRILFQGDPYNNFNISNDDHAIPQIPMTKDFSLEVRPTRDIDSVSIGIKKVSLIGVL